MRSASINIPGARYRYGGLDREPVGSSPVAGATGGRRVLIGEKRSYRDCISSRRASCAA